MDILESTAFLSHYGVLGMHWGVRKQEDRVTTSSSPASSSSGSSASKTTSVADFRSAAIKREEDRQGRTLNEVERNLLVGALIAGGIVVAAKKGRMGLESGAFLRLASKGKAFLTGVPALKRNEALSSKTMDVDEIFEKVVKQINPKFGAMGTKMNCRRATFAYEMRRRGFDVQATRTTNASGGSTQGLVNALSKRNRPKNGDPKFLNKKATAELRRKARNPDAKTPVLDLHTRYPLGINKVSNPNFDDFAPGPEGIFKALSKYPNGARGELVIGGNGAAHSVSWEIVKGKPVVFDNQSAQVYRIADDLPLDYMFAPQAAVTRLDNLKLNEDYLLRWLKNAA